MTLHVAPSRPTILVVQRRLTHYRVAFFEALRAELESRGFELVLAYGQPTATESSKHDSADLPWGIPLPTRYFLGGKVCWQPFGKLMHHAALTVVTQENKLIYNTWAQFSSRVSKIAFWGHGGNLQGNPISWKEKLKQVLARHVDWWFAYTQFSVPLILRTGFPAKRITVLNNAVDTAELRRQWQSVSPAEKVNLRESLGFGTGRVGVFVGSLYADKRLDFLFAAAEAIHREVPDFHLLIVGDGPERNKVQDWCDAQPWSRWVGARFGREKAAYVSVAQVMLNPGALGLGVMDAFVCQAPVITTDCGNHGPEIAYLENDVNGLITENDLNAYVEASVRLLRDAEALQALCAGCVSSAQKYTVENMARRFVDGIVASLSEREL